jgi:hypothetical protein
MTPSQRREEFLAKSLVHRTLALLAPPAGATLRGSGGGSSGGDIEYWHQRVDTGLSSPEVLQHYAAQLDALGWRRGPGHREAAFALQIWTFRDAEANPWRGILSVSQSATAVERQNLELELIRLPESTAPLTGGP